jgi:DNA-binding HxlR family transcriptional regulator
MRSARTYGQRCAAAHALDLVGDRWALLVVRDLLLGPKRFTDLRTGLPGASPNVLSQRLRDLEEAGVVRRRRLPPPAASRVYELTPWGHDLEPVIAALGRWGVRSPRMPRDIPMSVDSFAVALRSLFDPSRARGLDATLRLRVRDEDFTLGVSGEGLELERGEPRSPDAALAGEPESLAALVWSDAPLASLEEAGLTVEGDRAAVERIRGLFPYPASA